MVVEERHNKGGYLIDKFDEYSQETLKYSKKTPLVTKCDKTHNILLKNSDYPQTFEIARLFIALHDSKL